MLKKFLLCSIFLCSTTSEAAFTSGTLDPNFNASAAGDAVVARYTSSGILDTTFNSALSGDNPSAGSYIVNHAGNSEYNDMVIDVLDRIVCGGNAGGTGSIVATRFTTGGVLDSYFNSDGIYTQDFGSAEVIQGLAIDSVGKILYCGNGATSGNLAMIARLYGAHPFEQNGYGNFADNTIDIRSNALFEKHVSY